VRLFGSLRRLSQPQTRGLWQGEVPLGTTYRELIEMAGGMQDGRKFKALLPSGGSGPIIVEDALDATCSYEGLTPYRSVMGSASVIVMDETTDMVWAALKMTHFFRHESCGKCTPCREGTFWMDSVLHDLYYGHGTEKDIKLLESVANQMQGKCLCALGEFATSPVLSTIRYFLDEYKAKVTGQSAPRPVTQPSRVAVPVAAD
jgi:NADH-quinone oxidoreductase subunit F